MFPSAPGVFHFFTRGPHLVPWCGSRVRKGGEMGYHVVEEEGERKREKERERKEEKCLLKLREGI